MDANNQSTSCVTFSAVAGSLNLAQFLERNSTQVLEAATNTGAALFRGFVVSSERMFEDAVLQLKGLRAMDCYFMSEPGRDLVQGPARFVFWTNKNRKTGGSWFIDGVHTENYYSPDVPRFVAFWCTRPAWLRGGTGLVDMAAVYADLDDDLKSRLEEASFFAGMYTIESISKRYKVAPEFVEEMCARFKLPVLSSPKGVRFVPLFKPSVFDHPITRRPALTVNLCLELRGFQAEIERLFLKDYSGLEWTLHRFLWGHKGLVSSIRNSLAMMSSVLLRKPLIAPVTHELSSDAVAAVSSFARAGSAFSERDVKVLAELVRKHFTLIQWMPGDVLLLDNQRLAHTGMPGIGPRRQLRVLLLNPMALDLSVASRGRQLPADRLADRSVAEFITSKTR